VALRKPSRARDENSMKKSESNIVKLTLDPENLPPLTAARRA
jgi:hypothetical protein